MIRTIENEALEIIEELLDTIGWLGGDSYEMECIEPSIKKAEDFVYKHKEQIADSKIPRFIESKIGIYTTKDNKGKIIRAVNRRNAKNILGVDVNKVKCIRAPIGHYQNL